MRLLRIYLLCLLITLSIAASAEQKPGIVLDKTQSNLVKCRAPASDKQTVAFLKDKDKIYAVCCCADINGNKCCGNAGVCGGPIPGCSCSNQ